MPADIYHLKITVDTNLDAYLRPQGSIMIGVGAGFALGWLVGSAVGGCLDEDGTVYGICAGLVLLGLPLDLVGSSMIKKSIRSFNSANGFAERNIEVNLGVQNYGLGLALKF